MLVGKKTGKVIMAAVLAFAIAFTPGVLPAPVEAASTLSALQSKQDSLKKQQAEIEAKLNTLKSDKTQKLAYKNELLEKMDTVENQIYVYNAQINMLNANIEAKESQISAKQVVITRNFDKLKERVRALYIMGEASNLEIIMNAKNITDFADKAEMLKAITSHDTQLINTLKTDLKAIQGQKAEIEKNRAQVASAKKDMDAKNSQLDSLIKETQAAVDAINANQSDANAQKAKFAKQREEADAAVDQWYKNYYASQINSGSGGGNGSGGSAGSAGSAGSGGSISGGGSGGYASKGIFVWPVPGVRYISSPFGDMEGRSSPHKGMDIAGPKGSTIVAADSGKVVGITTGWGAGYGNSIYIDHGNGYTTRYAHCDSLCVSMGQIVTKGQTIAYMGSTGESTGNHCHFEVRINGVPKNPMNFFG